MLRCFLYSLEMAYKRIRTSGKSKCSEKKSPPFAVSLNSRKRKGVVTTNSQVQKKLESLLQKRGKVRKSQQEEGFIDATLAATAPLWLLLAVKGVKRYFTENGEFVLTECQEYNYLKDIPITINDISENMDVTDTVVDTSMLSIQRLLNTVKSRVGIMYHSKV